MTETITLTEHATDHVPTLLEDSTAWLNATTCTCPHPRKVHHFERTYSEQGFRNGPLVAACYDCEIEEYQRLYPDTPNPTTRCVGGSWRGKCRNQGRYQRVDEDGSVFAYCGLHAPWVALVKNRDHHLGFLIRAARTAAERYRDFNTDSVIGGGFTFEVDEDDRITVAGPLPKPRSTYSSIREWEQEVDRAVRQVRAILDARKKVREEVDGG